MIRSCTKWIERISSKSCPLVKLYSLYYHNMVREEIKLANVRSSDKVLCIGGGSIPCTAIELAKQTNAQVHVIDIDKDAVKCAKKVIAKLGLHENITVINRKGEDIDIAPYDVIHIALQVSPKEKVLKNIWEKAREGNRIIVRMPRKSLKLFYSNIRDDYVENSSKCIKTMSIHYKTHTMDEILCLEKI